MKKLILFIAVFLFAFELNTPYHIGIITDIVHDKNHFYIPARDGMLKIYDKNFKNIYTFYEYGSINSVAVNDKYIVYSGSLGRFFNGIKIYDKNRKKLIKIFNVGRVVSRIRYYKQKFYATTTDGIIYVIDKNLNLSKIYYGNSAYSKALYGIDFYKNYLYFVNWAGEVIKYNLDTNKVEDKIKFNDRLQSISISKNKIAVCGNGYEINILSPSLNLLKTIVTSKKIMSCKLSNNYLVATPVLGDALFYKNFKQYKTIKNIDLSLGIDIKNNDVIFSNGKNIIITGLDNDAVKYINSDVLDISNVYNYYPNVTLITKNGKIGFNLDYLSYSYAKINDFDFDLNLDYQVVTRKLKDDTLIINNRCYIQRDATDGYRHRKVKKYKNYIISSGDWGVLDIYDNRCVKIASLYGDFSSIRGFDIKDDKLITFSSKEEINIYDLNELKNKLPFLRVLFFKDKKFVAFRDNFYYSNGLKVNDLILDKNRVLEKNITKITLPYKTMKKVNFEINSINKCGKYLVLSDFSNKIAFFDLKTKSIVENKYLSIHSMKCDDKALYIGGYNTLSKIYLDDFGKYSIKTSNIYKMALGKKLFVLDKNNNLYIYDKNLNKLKTYQYKKPFKITPLKNYKIAIKKDKQLIIGDIQTKQGFILGKGYLEAISDKYYLVGKEVKDKNRNTIYKIKNFFYKAKFLGDNLYYIDFDNLIKVNLRTKKITKVNLHLNDIDIKDNKLYLCSKYKVFIFNQDLKLLQKYNLKFDNYQNVVKNKNYIAFIKNDEVILLKNFKVIKRFKYKYVNTLLMNDKYLIYGNDILNIYSLKKKKIIKTIKNDEWSFEGALIGDELYFNLSDNLIKLNLKTFKKTKLLKLPKYMNILNIDNELIFEKDYSFYKLKNNKLKLFIVDADGYYKKGNKTILCNIDKFEVKLNNSKTTRKFDSLRLTPIAITKNYFVLNARDGVLHIWDMNFNEKLLKFSKLEYVINGFSLSNDKILIFTNYNNFIIVDLKHNNMKYLTLKGDI